MDTRYSVDKTGVWDRVTKRYIPDRIYFTRLRDDAVIPSYANTDDVGMDMTLTHLIKVENGIAYFGTGLAVEPPRGQYVEIHPRSSLPKKGWTLANNTGIIDSGYRGELIVALQPTIHCYMKALGMTDDPVLDLASKVELPTKFTQLVLRDRLRKPIMEIDTLSESDRGTGGFGSTDAK